VYKSVVHFLRKKQSKSFHNRRNEARSLQEQLHRRTYMHTVPAEGKIKVYLHQTGFDLQFTRYYQCTLDDNFQFYLTGTARDADVVVFINTIDSSIALPGQKVILFFHEPSMYAYLYQSVVDEAFASEHDLEVVTHLPDPGAFLRGTISRRVHRTIPYVHFHHNADRALVNQAHEGKRDKLVCSITSGLSGMVGYENRRKFIEEFTKTNSALDLYGKYNRNVANLASYRGECDSKWQTMGRYKYNLVIESAREDWYVSEKVFDSIICGCFPIYYGSDKVLDILPANSVYYLPDLDSESLAKLNVFLQSHEDGIVPTVSKTFIYENFSFYKALENIILGKSIRFDI
jgi:Glycosyltransferase family 10 (fucosyltransferase) C-term